MWFCDKLIFVLGNKKVSCWYKWLGPTSLHIFIIKQTKKCFSWYKQEGKKSKLIHIIYFCIGIKKLCLGLNVNDQKQRQHSFFRTQFLLHLTKKLWACETLKLRDFSFSLFGTFIYEPILPKNSINISTIEK